MTWKIVRVLEGRCLSIMRLHVNGRFPVKWLANLILFTQPSAVSVAAVKWIDSRAWLQFQFFLNLFSRLLATNLSRWNNRSRTSPQTLLRFQRNGKRQWIPIYIPRLFTLSCCHQRYSLDRGRMQMTRFWFYDHNATKSECAHRLEWRTPTSVRRRSSRVDFRLRNPSSPDVVFVMKALSAY